MQSLSLASQPRTETKKAVLALRQQDKIPAIVYGHGFAQAQITIGYGEFEKVYKQAGNSTLVDLDLGTGAPVKVLIKEVQREPMNDRITHADFHVVRTDEKLKIDIILHFNNIAPAVKDLGGILVTPITKLEVACLPKDLVHEIEVDISNLKTFDDVIRVCDIALPAGILALSHAEEVVALVQPPRTEQELASLEEKPVAAAAPEKVGADTADAADKIDAASETA